MAVRQKYIVVVGEENWNTGEEYIRRMYGPFNTRTAALRYSARDNAAIKRKRSESRVQAWVRTLKKQPKRATRAA